MPYPHTGPYVLNVTGQSPFSDRLSACANYAIDRRAGKPAQRHAITRPALSTETRGSAPPQTNPGFDPAKSKARQEATMTSSVKVKVMISTPARPAAAIPMN